ncbi:hypothetical protein RsY01_1098 [Lactococcus reticulitermitis]|uniref:Uncharacterized protein n=1 Tax=Pseudolactococcus reticulitermitis TaxID=2025039 RepID=A0A224WZL3_9LACT|nr:DUF6688 family protein [Lactococcus reticulitermitis]GAX47498.1 hypothetical protein RsY01_1098 [Lactococcus reticulitermitis]
MVLGLLVLIGVLCVPFLSILNIIYLLTDRRRRRHPKFETFVEILTFSLGGFLAYIYLDYQHITNADWSVSIFSNYVHTPIAAQSRPTLQVLFLVALIGYLILKYNQIKQLPPLVLVFALANLYIGMGITLLCLVQMLQKIPLAVYFINVLLIGFKLIVTVVRVYQDKLPEIDSQQTSVITRLKSLIQNASNWPWIAFILAIPLLGVIIAVLSVFGQAPDSVIKAWTETADWTLSEKISAPDLAFHDDHYLCTVAAMGHRKLVKSQRMGIRAGRKIVVNRQLCIANAFEQIIQEKTPKVHYYIRRVYDRYGYPIARKINSQYTADLVYLIMKPLE